MKFVTKFLHLRQNMCLGYSEADNQHAQWLLEIGAESTMDNNEMIQVPQSMVCANLNSFINRIYLEIRNSRAQDDQYFLDRIILEMIKSMISMRPFSNSSTQLQRSIC